MCWICNSYLPSFLKQIDSLDGSLLHCTVNVCLWVQFLLIACHQHFGCFLSTYTVLLSVTSSVSVGRKVNLVKETSGKEECEFGKRNTKEKRNVNLVIHIFHQGKQKCELGERNTREKRDVNLVKKTPGKKRCEFGERNTTEKRCEFCERNIRGKCSHSHKQLELPSTHHLSEAEIVTLCLNI